MILKAVAMLTALLIALCMPFSAVSAENENTVVAVSSSAGAAILYEPTSGRVLYEKNAHSKRPMASTTKLMTALLAVELLSPDAVLTASANALAVEGSSMGLHAGDTITRDDLLCGLLLSSGNDAANVLALSMAESFGDFAVMMNDRAARIGMTNSHFVTPSGLDADGHGASAYDMALLATQVLQCEELAAICAAKTATITVGDRRLTLQNHNKLLSQYDGCIGMKTGYTSLAGRCLVSAATRNGVTLIAVTLDCSNDWEEHKTMLDEGFSLVESVDLIPPSLPLLTVFGAAESTVSLTALPTTVSVMSGDTEAIQTRLLLPPYVWAPIDQGETVGCVQYRLRGAVIAEVPVTVMVSVKQQERSAWLARVEQLFWLLLRRAMT